VNAEFFGQLVERQQRVLSFILAHNLGCSLEHSHRHRSTTTIPGAQRLEWNRQHLRKLSLAESK
jgi:hypothetical protein